MFGFPIYPLEETVDLEYDRNFKKEYNKMCDGREPRESEKMFEKIMKQFLYLNNCVWCGGLLKKDAEYRVGIIKRDLDKMLEQMKKEV